VGHIRLSLDGAEVFNDEIQDDTDVLGAALFDPPKTVHAIETAAGQLVRIEAEYRLPKEQIIPFTAILLGEETVVADPQAEIDAAVEVARASDVAVVVVGTNAAIESEGEPRYAVAFVAPRGGTVLEKKVVAGEYVTEGQELYLLADLSAVWLMAQVYEHELSRISPGQAAEATVSAVPGKSFRGRVAFVDPVLDRETRSARVRIALANPRRELKPGMFGDARLETTAPPSLVVPKSALIDTGARRVVYVETSPNTFQARDVKTGESSGDRVAVLEGLAAGERVVAAANFFIDSQAQLSSGSSIQWSGALDVKATPAGPRP